MGRYAIISEGVVVNMAAADADFASEQGWISAPDEVGIGWLYDGEAFSAPAAPATSVPDSVTMRQGRLALLGAGMLGDVDAALAAIPDLMQRRAAQIEWEYAQTIDRNSAWVGNLSSALGLTGEQLDQLFIQASTL